MKYILYIIIFVGFIGAMPKRPYYAAKVWVTTTGYLNLGDIETVYGLVGGDTLALTAGTATGMFLQNVNPTGQIVVLGSDSGTYINGTIEVNSSNSLYFLKIKAHDVTGRWFFLEESKDNITIEKCRIDRSNDYQIYMHSATPYNGTLSTSFDNILIANDTFRGCGNANTISTGGAVTTNLWIHDCWVDSTYGVTSTGFSFTDNIINGLIENNKFTNINLGGTSHNSVIYWQGWGTIRNNLSNNRQGDFIRCRPYTVDSSATNPLPDTTYVYNNRDCSARKYAFIEMQHKVGDTTTNTNLPNTRTGILLCLNNTCLNTRTADYTPFLDASGGGAGLADVYDWFRPPIFKNNVCGRAYLDSVPDPYNPPARFTFNYMFHSGGGSKPPAAPVFGDTSNNIYMQVLSNLSANWGGIDSLTMNLVANSPAKSYGTSAYLYKVPTGYRGNSRSPFVDAGADQFNTWIWGPVKWKAVKTVH